MSIGENKGGGGGTFRRHTALLLLEVTVEVGRRCGQVVPKRADFFILHCCRRHSAAAPLRTVGPERGHEDLLAGGGEGAERGGPERTYCVRRSGRGGGGAATNEKVPSCDTVVTTVVGRGFAVGDPAVERRAGAKAEEALRCCGGCSCGCHLLKKALKTAEFIELPLRDGGGLCRMPCVTKCVGTRPHFIIVNCRMCCCCCC